MRGNHSLPKLTAGAILFAAFVFALTSAPGFLSDLDSTAAGPAPQLEAAQ